MKQRPSRRKRLRSGLAGTWTLAAAGPLAGGLGLRPGGRRGGGRTAATATAAGGPGAWTAFSRASCVRRTKRLVWVVVCWKAGLECDDRSLPV